jgi:hypothetical protein
MATYTSNATVNIPANAANVRVTVVGARGGNGGNDGNPGGTGGNGRGGTFSLSDFTARTLTLNVGQSGGNGFGCVSSSGNGSGGSGVASGGGGGRTGPQGCSGGGGGGGGATGVYDSVANAWIIVSGGGGGAGGASYPDSFLRGGDGGFGQGFNTGNVGNISNGGTGSSQGFDGGGGGGGGGGCPGGGGGREGADDRAGRYPSLGGTGGASGYNSSYASLIGSGFTYNGSGYVDISYDLVTPSVNSFTVNPTSIIRGQTTRLSWSTSNATGASINNGVGTVSTNGFVDVSPTTTTTYTLSLTGLGNTSGSGQVTVIVYQPPVLTLSLDRNPISIGESTTLRWSTSGDASSITWTAGGITNGNLNSFSAVAPTDSITYVATVSGLGGSDSDSIRLVVYQRPTVSLSVPTSILYNQQSTISYTSSFSNTSLTLTPVYTYGRGVGTITGTPVSLTTPTSAESGVGITTVSANILTQIPYNSTGPFSVSYTLTGVGGGGSAETTSTIDIIVDEVPENINVPETDELFKEQEPIYVPDYEVTSNYLEILDIDIPVEIKSDKPIKVDINQQQDWQDLRQL